jgi:predicted nucleic acid-binding protein
VNPPGVGLLDTSVFILTDALIAATAIEHGLPVVAQDGDFERISAAHPALRVLKV